MSDPFTNRLRDYEANWLTLIVSMGIATTTQAEAAMHPGAQQAIDDMKKRRKRRRRRGA